MSTMPADRNRDLLQALFDRVINAHDLAPVEQLYSPDYLQHNPAVPQGVSGLKLFLELLFTAFPDIRGNIVLSVSEADRVMALIEWTGTHTGPFIGIEPTGRKVEFRSAEIFRIENARFAEHWDVVDNVEMQLTLGMLRR
jgi:predicted ester cyclase